MNIKKTIIAFLLISLAQTAFAAKKTFTLNLKNIDIRSFINSVSKKTGKNFVVDPRVKAKINVISSSSVDAKELYNIFLSVLQVHGYSAIPSGKIIKIVPDVNAKQGPVPIYSKRQKASDQLVTSVIRIHNVPAAQLVPILRPLIPQQGHLAAYAATNTLILTDRIANIQRLQKIIAKVDIADNQEIEVIPLTHASASEVVRIINALNQKRPNNQSNIGKSTLAADNRTNSILISGDHSNRLRLRVLISHLDTPLKNHSGNTRVFYLHYANAKDLATLLKGVADANKKNTAKQPNTNLNNQKVDIRAHETTNALVITAPPAEMQNLKTIISQLDIRRAQVLVEAIIAEIKEDKSRELGVQFASNGLKNGGITAATSFAAAGSGNLLALSASSTPPALSGLSLLLADTTGNFGGLVRALKADAATNILSTPSIVTLDNQEAKIVVGQNAPFVTGSYTTTGNTGSTTNPFQTIERQDIGLTLKVKPQINEGNTIKMEISQEVSNIASSSTSYGPTTNKRTINTTVLVEDGQTLVLGGLIDDTVQEKEEQIPLLGSIPILGSLFTYTKTSKIKQNLMVFIHPTILRDIATSNLNTNEKYNYIRSLQSNIAQKGIDLLDEEMPVLPEISVITTNSKKEKAAK